MERLALKSSSVLVVASNFPPVQSAGVYRTIRLAKYLPDYSWDISVLTLAVETLPKDTRRDPRSLEQITNEIAVYRAPARFPLETINRITGRGKHKRMSKPSVKTISKVENKSPERSNATSWTQQFKDRITLPWMTPDRLVGWVRPASKKGIAITRNNRFDLIYSSGPPWSNHLVANRISKSIGLPWVADFRDPWCGNAFRPSRNGDTWEGRKHRELELDVYRAASAVIFNTEPAQQNAVERIGDWLAEKSTVIPNGFDPAHFASLSNVSTATNKLEMIHAGSFYGKRNVDTLLQAIGKLKQSGVLTTNNFQLELVGNARNHEKQMVEELSISDLVTLTPAVAHGECLNRLNASDVLLLVQTDAPLCVPGKLYEYIAIGKPIFTLATEGATTELVKRERLGICCDPADIAQIATSLTRLLDQNRTRQFETASANARSRYNGREQMATFNDIFQRVILNSTQTRSPIKLRESV